MNVNGIHESLVTMEIISDRMESAPFQEPGGRTLSATKPSITPSPNGPYLVKDLQTLQNSQGEQLETQPTFALCRCGGSKKKPFCDGTHAKIGFSDKKEERRTEDRRHDYTGEVITVHDNRGICAHASLCSDGLSAVFQLEHEPWIDPDAAQAEEIIAIVKSCPSGALSYSVDREEQRDQAREPAIRVSKNGPYLVTGGPELVDVGRGQGASTEHFTLCRCGASKNKPFCDGSHWSIRFEDEET